MANALKIILEIVAPLLGTLLKQAMWLAPWGAVQEAIVHGELGNLNPMPWVFMMGSTLGFCVYGIVIQNYWAFFANVGGLLFSVYYNLQAVKLQFYGHNSSKLRESIIAALNESKHGDDLSSDPNMATLVWDVISLNVQAPVAHDQFVILMVLFWTIIITIIGLFQVSPGTAVAIAGYTNLVMKVLLCAAPVSVILTVLRTCSSATLHRPTLLANLMDTIFWASYGLAIQDKFIALPSLIGMVFSVLLFALALLLPQAPAEDKEELEEEKKEEHEETKESTEDSSASQLDLTGGKDDLEGDPEIKMTKQRSLATLETGEDRQREIVLPALGDGRPTLGPRTKSMVSVTKFLPHTYITKSSSKSLVHKQQSALKTLLAI